MSTEWLVYRSMEVLFWYFVVMALLWAVGFESIYLSPTPFYAAWAPVFVHKTVPVAVAALAVATSLAVRHYLARKGFALRPGSRAWYLAVVLAGAAALVAAIESRNHPEDFEDFRRVLGMALRPHARVIGVAAGALALLWAALQHMRWPSATLDRRRTVLVIAGIVVFCAVFSSSVAMIRGGSHGISQAYERQTYEYIGDIGKGGSIRGLFREYNRYLQYPDLLSMHSKVHPPGPVVILWVLSFFVGQGALALSLATIAVGSLAVIPLFLWSRELCGARVALIACLLYSVMPSIVLFTATSADILFMPLTLTTLFLFWRALHRRSIRYAIAAGVMYAMLSLTSFSLLSIGAFFGFVGLWRLASAEYRVSVMQTAAVMLGAFAAVHLLVWLWSGFNVIECFRLCKANFDTDQAMAQVVTPRYPAWVFRLLNPLCWFYFAGIPVSILFIWRLLRPEQDTKALFLVIFMTLFVLNLLYIARGEGERSAMYVFPFVVLPASHLLDRLVQGARSAAPLAAALILLAAQCWLTETLFYTYW